MVWSGAQRMQQAWLRVLDRSLSLAVRGPAGPNFKSMTELVAAQQSLYVEAFNNAVEWGTRLLQLAERVAQKAG